MKNTMRGLGIACALWASVGVGRAETVAEPARELPLMESTDVLVVGGGLSAVAAALSAQEAGARVFVVMPRQNPGDDLVSTRRLWAMDGDEETDDPLVRSVFPFLDSVPFSYDPSHVAVTPHTDDSHSVLTDGAYGDVQYETAQYGTAEAPIESVSFMLTPKLKTTSVKAFKVIFHAATSSLGNYGTGEISVTVDGAAVSGSGELVSNSAYKTWVYTLEHPIDLTSVETITLTCQTAEDCCRQLIGEIQLVPESPLVAGSTSPAKVFKALDAALLTAKIPYFTGAQACDVLRDASGRVSGVVVATRNGRQAIAAKTVIDATEWGSVVRQVATLKPVAAGETRFTAVVTMNRETEPQLGEGYDAVERESVLTYVSLTPADLRPKSAPAGYALKTLAISKSFPLASSDYLAVNAIAQQMRSDLWQVSIVDQSEKPFFVPPVSIVGAGMTVTAWTSAAELPLAAFTATDDVLVAGMTADVDRSVAERLSYPGVSVAIGRRLGVEAASRAAARGDLGAVSCGAVQGGDTADVREAGGRPKRFGSLTEGTVSFAGGALPVLETVDVLVVGGGTAGGPAAIAAAGEGKRVMVTEWTYAMGGTTTSGRIGRYWYGNVAGFTRTLDANVKGNEAKGWVFSESKSEWLRSEAIARGATVVYGAFAEGVLVTGQDAEGRDQVRGVVVVLPDGTRAIVRASVVIDATGNADLAAAAGAETTFLPQVEFAMQGSAASPHNIGESYRNTDVGFLNTPDAGDLFTFALRARLGLPDEAWNLANVNVGARERRRIVGDAVLGVSDILLGRTYDDTIMHGRSNFDMHGFTTSDLMMFFAHTSENIFSADVPYRALLPRTLDGVLTTGLAISAERDAMPIVRMQPDVQNQGYAAGLAAAMACEAGSVRAIDVKTLQSRLVADGCLQNRVLSDVDSVGGDAALAEAVASLDLSFAGLPRILAFPETALPLVRSEFAVATEAHQQALACALLLLGDETGSETVAEAFASADPDQGYNFRGLGNFGRQTAPFDCFLFALTKSRNPKAEAIIARSIATFVKNDQTRSIRPLSHFRMAARAAETFASDRIASQFGLLLPLNAALSNRTKTGTPEAVSYKGENDQDSERAQAIRELAHLRARHLVGDATADTALRAYLDDYRTIYASYAEQVLALPQIATPVGTWTDADTLELNLGKPSEPAALSGVVSLADATLKITAGSDAVDANYVLMPEGDFEPSTQSLPADKAGLSGQGTSDRRALRDPEYFAANYSYWVFDPASNGNGVTVDGGYFTPTYGESSIRLHGENNKHAAFLFLTGGQVGTISQTFTVPKDGTKVAIKYDVESRYFSNTSYIAKHYVLLDGIEIDTYPESDSGKINGWLTREVDLGTLTAGEHTIAFKNGTKANTGLLIDNVMMSMVSPSTADGKFPKDAFTDLSFDLGADVTCLFEGDFTARVGKIRVNGKTQSELADGNGRLTAPCGVFVIIR